MQTFVIVFDYLPASPSGLLATVVTSFQLLYVLSPIRVIVVQIDESFVGVIKQLPGVLAVIPDVLHKVHTTHSWDFLGLEQDGNGAWKDAAKYGEAAIIGNVDTGVWPESTSFNDDGYADISPDWHVKCIAGNDTTFKCNKKLIAARFFNLGFLASGLLQGKPPSQAAELYTPRDYIGHGTHTLSTAGGGFVPDASVFGHGKGTAKGGSPLARVAAYKACYAEGCSSSDILAAMVAAVEDGVNVLSLSVGGPADDYLSDPIAIGAFYAVQKGVTVVCSASNSGPQPGSVTNVAPWILTVGASTMDRDFPAYVTFGGVASSAITIKGQSLSDSTLPQGQRYAMINSKNANAANVPSDNSTLCFPGSLDSDKVSGKIVVCTRGVNARVEKGMVVKQAGGIGMVLCNDAGNGDDVIADTHLIAAAHVSYSQCINLFNYLGSTHNPVGYITASGDRLGVKPAPVMAAFSSRGPNPITPQILKPDITAPGVSVIAAYSEAVSPTELPLDNRRVPYNIMSGTSMSCPHVSGIVGLIKTKYPDWTPAMIKSAIMTTAITGDNDSVKIRDETGAAATPFAYGSGHVRPVRALDPGLVYDTTAADYANFLCSLRPTQNPLPLPVFGDDGKPCACSQGAQYGRPEDLNYPSIAVPCLSGSATVRRWVKNVVAAPCRYAVSVTEQLAGVKITVDPPVLSFGYYGEEREFTVRLEVQDAAAAANYVFGSIEWSEESELDPDRKHRVRSPIVAKTTCG
uniref:Subtilisin-like protease n=1 Tax=Oryza punctata TaxID=4537 RepID=A0A0E0JMY1_ORYPU